MGQLIVLVLFAACNREGAGCFDKAGPKKTISVELPAFTAIDVTSNVDVLLLADGNNRAEITTGENLLSGISLEVEEGVLKIDNHNRCFWSIGYEHPLVTIRNPDISRIIQHGYGMVFNEDTLDFDGLYLQVEDASGAIDLKIKANSVQVVSNNVGPITLIGTTNKLSAGHYWSDGILNAKDLKTTDCYINHNGSNRMELNVSGKLDGKMTNLGNVYLYGQRPTEENVIITGAGKVVEMF